MRTTPRDLATLRDAPRRLLAVFAHPNDEAYGAAGALARAGADGDAVAVLLCLTNGEASTALAARGLDPPGIAALRTERMHAVARRLALGGLLLPGLPDGRLARLPLADVAAVVRDVLEALDPQVVVAQDARGVNGHADHVAAHWAVRRALEGRIATRLALVAYPPAVAEASRPRLIFPTREDEIDVVVRLTAAEAAAKEDCLRIHEAHVTLSARDAGLRLLREPVERYDLLGESLVPPREDLFADLPPRV